MPIQILIDDVGWRCGIDGHEYNEPFRTGINRDHVPADYLAVAELGKRLDIRPLVGMILSEWDTKNILKDLPTSTWMGENWDNSRCVGPWLEEAAQIIIDNGDHLELAVHGLGHEYWDNGQLSRAEWFDIQYNMRPKDQVEAHLDYYEQLLNQHGLGPMPRAFSSCASLHSFGADQENFANILGNRGISYILTPFQLMKQNAQPYSDLFGIDSGVITIDRGTDPVVWNALDTIPPATLTGQILGLHWPNILHHDPCRNSEPVARWCEFLKRENRTFDRTLSPNIDSFCQQLIHHQVSSVKLERQNLIIDTRGYFEIISSNSTARVMIKVESDGQLCLPIDRVTIRNESKIDANRTITLLEITAQSDKPIVAIPIVNKMSLY